jgi:hypothetical protein
MTAPLKLASYYMVKLKQEHHGKSLTVKGLRAQGPAAGA